LKLLFADDEKSLQEVMRLELPRMGHEVTVCPDGTTAVAALERNVYDCLLVDLDMPGLKGIDVITRAKELSPDTDAIILTGKSSLDSAVAAIRQGVFDYLTKPCKLADLEAVLRCVAEKRELNHKYQAIKKRLAVAADSSDLIGDCPKMLAVKRLVAKVAPTDSTVLILGETGTGKELIARAVHNQSLRADKPFVPINCGALPENLIESELFGHRKGAFTGADEHRTGLIEVADGGTLFLDEIGELPKPLQAKLLRFLESGEIRRVGDNASFTCDVRVVCATHRHLDEMVAADDFREDLWYRVNTFEIEIPPLRDRTEDIPRLARHFALRCGARVGNEDEVFTPDAMDALCSHHWPGNVRELANAVEHAMILCERPPIGIEHMPHRFSARRATVPMPRPAGSPTFSANLREREMQTILEVLERHNGNKPKAAEELGISVKTLYNKLNQTGPMSKTG
jgi:two-component system NtrC family response regulator